MDDYEYINIVYNIKLQDEGRTMTYGLSSTRVNVSGRRANRTDIIIYNIIVYIFC